jgi:hypothetical protein
MPLKWPRRLFSHTSDLYVICSFNVSLFCVVTITFISCVIYNGCRCTVGDEYVVQLMNKSWDMMWDTLQCMINPFWSNINWMPGIFCQCVNFCTGVMVLENDTGTQNMKYWADKNIITHRNFLMGLIADGTLHSLNCDFQWDNCQELYHSSIPD